MTSTGNQDAVVTVTLKKIEDFEKEDVAQVFEVRMCDVRIGHIEQWKVRTLSCWGYDWQAVAGGSRSCWYSMAGAVGEVLAKMSCVIADQVIQTFPGIIENTAPLPHEEEEEGAER